MFPTNPHEGQVVTVGGIHYTFHQGQWTIGGHPPNGGNGGGGPTGDWRYEHNFNAVGPAHTVTVTHNLNQSIVLVQCVDNGSPRRHILPDVNFTSHNALILTFSEPVSGTVVVRK